MCADSRWPQLRKKIMTQIEKYYPVIALSLLLSIFVISSCEKESIEDLCTEESLGEIFLVESSRNSIPFNENTSLYFKDSLENETVFQFEVENDGYKVLDRFYHVICEFDTSLVKIYQVRSDQYRYYISESTKTLNLTFILHLQTQPSSYFPFNIDTISDQLGVLRSSKTDSTLAYANNLNILVNPRNLSEDNIKNYRNPVDEITLLNRTFYNVFISNGSNEYYSYEAGLIAFRDWDKKLWVLDKVEKNNK